MIISHDWIKNIPPGAKIIYNDPLHKGSHYFQAVTGDQDGGAIRNGDSTGGGIYAASSITSHYVRVEQSVHQQVLERAVTDYHMNS